MRPGLRALVVWDLGESVARQTPPYAGTCALFSLSAPQGPRMVPRCNARLQSATVPELPDLAILAEALDTALGGRQLEELALREPLVLRGTPAEVAALAGQQLQGVTRRGKFLDFTFARDRLVINAMLTGRLGLAGPGTKPWPRAAAVLSFAPGAAAGHSERRGTSRAGRRAPAWLRGAEWLPAANEPVQLRYRDATRMGKLYLLPAGVDRPVAGWDEQGPDADDPALTLDEWRQRIRRHSGELKNLLRNQAFVAGIGNAYSDEVLWAARLAPYRTRASLTADEIDALYHAVREVLPWAIEQLRARVPPNLEVEQRGFLRVHARAGQTCPRCGTKISAVKAGGSETNFCRSCQR
jgi:formamidopyrimidine-DNA glycosylase